MKTLRNLISSPAMVFIVLLLSACSNTNGTTSDITTPSSIMGTQTGNMQVSGSEIDEMFINMMVPHHQGAVAMAQIALERSERAEIRELADAIITSQEDEIERMRNWKEQWYGDRDTPLMSEMPMMQSMPGMSGGHTMDMQAEVDALEDAPEPFDLAFIDAMIPHHQSAIDAAQMVIEAAVHPELNVLAEQIKDAQQDEINKMLEWRQAWFPDAPALE